MRGYHTKEVLLRETGKGSGEERNWKRQVRRRNYYLKRHFSFSLILQQLWNINCTSEFVPTAGKGAGL